MFSSDLTRHNSGFLPSDVEPFEKEDSYERSFLKSVDRTDVARVLTQLYLDELSTTEPVLAGLLQTYMDRVLESALNQSVLTETPKSVSHTSELLRARIREENERDLEALASSQFDEVRPNVRTRNAYLAHLARLSQILELSGHLARENFFDIKRHERDLHATSGGVPGGIERSLMVVRDDREGEFFTKADRRYVFKTLDEAIHYFNIPILELALTQHPTNVLTLATIRLKRETHNAIREICDNPGQRFDKLKATLQAFAHNELTPVDSKSETISNFNARDEIDFTLDTVKQADTNLIDLYGTYERSFRRRFGAEYSNAKRWPFFLNVRFTSWTLGDKDGNNNVKAEHLLYASVRHRLTALEIAQKHMAAIADAGVSLDPHVHQSLIMATETLTGAHAELERARLASGGVDIILTQPDFDRLNHNASNAMPGGWDLFERTYTTALEAMGRTATEPQQNAILEAYRSIKTFGTRAARIELRETSKEYTNVIALLVRHNASGKPINYEGLSDKQRATLLDELISQNPDYLRQQATAFLRTADATKLRVYSEQDPSVIAYHTLKRFAVCAHNPDLFTDSILAECKGATNALECLALQTMVVGPSGPLRQNIVPLFEESSTLRSIARTLKGALRFRSYREHVLAIAQMAFRNLRQKFQIAHSDNIRRSGTPAGRGGIHAANHDVPRAMRRFENELRELYRADLKSGTADLKLTLEPFQGLSLSHILRGGGRPLSALSNAFKSHRHLKITVQGADQQSYLGLPSSFKRMLARFFVHNAKEIALQENTTPAPDSDRTVERAIDRAFQASMSDYVDHHFGSETAPRAGGMGHLMAHPIINYAIYSLTGNRGLRSAARSGAVTKSPRFIDTNKGTRAIGIAENMFDADLLGTWLGSGNLLTNLSRELLGTGAYESFRRQVNGCFGMSAAEPKGERMLTTQELNGLYKTSPQYRDVIDQMACGLVTSNVNRLQRRMLHAEDRGITMNADVQRYVFETLPKDYASAADLVLKSFGIDYDSGHIAALSLGEQTMFLRHLVATHAIPSYASEYGVKGKFATAAVLARDEILSVGNEKLTDHDLRALSDIVAARMNASHGRVFVGEDPHYSSALEAFVRKFFRQSRLADAAL